MIGVLIGLGIAASASAAAGVGQTVKAGVNISKAKKLNEKSGNRVYYARNRLDNKRKELNCALGDLGKLKVSILNNSMKDFLQVFQKIKNVEFHTSNGIDEIKSVKFDKASVSELKEMENVADSLVTGGIAGVASGTLVAFGAYGAASTFGVASTGTSIAALSGAAASNATLAFLGGGALTVGGLGVAGGMAVLGGLVAGPALLVMGTITGANASKQLNEALSNKAKADKICEELKIARFQCEAISRRTYMFYDILTRLDAYFLPLVYQTEDIIESEGLNYKTYKDDSKKVIAATASMAGTIKAVLDIGILTENGSLTKESETVVTCMKKGFENKSSIHFEDKKYEMVYASLL